jgi:hypothetical protein
MRIARSIQIVVLLFVPSIGWSLADDGSAPKTVSVFDAATLSVPPAFKPVEAKSRIVEHEFEAREGDQVARMTMMASGGGIEANIARWKGQFSGGKAEAQKTEQIKVGNWDVHLVEVSGTYKDSMGGGPFAGGKTVDRADYAMVGAILVHPEGRTYFVKLVGPQATVKANQTKFVEMIKGMK